MCETKKRTRISRTIISDEKEIVCSYANQRVIAQIGQAKINNRSKIVVPIRPARGNNKTKPGTVLLNNLQFNSCASKCKVERQIREKLAAAETRANKAVA